MFIDVHTHKNTGDYTIKSFHLSENGNEIVRYAFPYSVGLHPWWGHLENFIYLENFCYKQLNKGLVAIGECGVDHMRGESLNIQSELFRKQVYLAKKLELPVIVHQVKAVEEVFKIIKECPDVTYILHGFSGTSQQMQQFSGFKVYFSLGFFIFNINDKISRLINEIPLEKLFFETDNHAISIEKVYERFAKVRNISVQKLQEQVSINFEKVFK